MRSIFKILMSMGAVLLLTLQMNLFTSCNDDMAAESYYTFTGEMLDDYLKNREQFSLFRQVVERADYMHLLHARGQYTMFPPTNDAMQVYMSTRSYGAVTDIPVEVCDTLVREHLINGYYQDSELLTAGSITNWLDIQYLSFKMSEDMDEDGLLYMKVNTYSNIINTLKNDSCENGMVHPVDRVIEPATDLGNELVKKHEGEISLFYEACRLTGILDVLATPYEDSSYDPSLYDELKKNIQSGFNGETYILKRPDRRLQGYTIFAVPDEIFKSEYGIDVTDMDAAIDDLYQLAVTRYTPVASDLGVTEEDMELYWKQDEEAYKNPKNPLNMFMSYHVLDRRIPSTEQLVNCWGINDLVANPTEWVNTLLEHSTLKIEKVYGNVDTQAEYPGGFYLNHSNATTYIPRVRGAHLTVPDAYDEALNSVLYYVDRVLAYDNEMRDLVMNTRIRLDFIALWPELTTNNIRLNGKPWLPDNSYDHNEEFPAGVNYYMPPGYLKNVTLNDDGIFMVMRPHNTFWNMGGDEINFLGSSYDCTFRLPSVPSGEYEIRLGFASGSTRGVAQIYYDGEPQGIPIDMRLTLTDPSIGGVVVTNSMTDSEILENNQTLKNNGYYRGPRGIYNYSDGGTTHTTPVYSPGTATTFDRLSSTYRILLCKVNVTGYEHHTIRVRSVYSAAGGAVFMLDYLEMVPNSICGVGGLGEDLY